MANHAQISTKSCFLFTEFGEQTARKWFGDEAVDALPRFVRGKNKGKIKGVIVWRKVEKGGWVSGQRYYGEASGRVETRVGQVVYKALCEMPVFGTPAEEAKVIVEMN